MQFFHNKGQKSFAQMLHPEKQRANKHVIKETTQWLPDMKIRAFPPKCW